MVQRLTSGGLYGNKGGCKARYKNPQASNEYYTPAETVDFIFRQLGERVRGRKIWFPCDSEKSEFVKFAKKNAEKMGFEWRASCSDFREGLHLGWCDMIVTNPPFSLRRDFTELCAKVSDFAVVNLQNCAYPYIYVLGDRVREFQIPGYFFLPSGELVRVSTGVCVNSFGLVSKYQFRGTGKDFQTDDLTGLKMYGLRQIPAFHLLPARFLATVSSLMVLDNKRFRLIKDHTPLVKGMHKYCYILWEKRK